ncbi:replicative DNA helicase [Plantactinospora sp. GCM10030261]|uniref:replicative DNA helicase n=1 Tax=Plantactinospora sp. GCM10030261 TaxID=3273420 RepID=UPI0036169EE6
MSVTDGARAEIHPIAPPPPSSGQSGGQFDKTPPQDIAAEQCVLGGMLLSKDAIADVVEILKTGDFYRPVHATIFDTILDLYGRGEPADIITVAATLADAGELVRIGGAPYLHTLIASVPTAANAAYYARIVAERAVLRRLVEAGTRIVQLGYGSAAGGGRDVDDIVDLAQQAVYDVTEKRVSEDFAVLADMLQPTLDEIEAVGAQGGVMTGVPTGFTDLDRLLNGLHPGQLIIVAGRPGLGKALALDTPLPTPDGWTTMGEVKAGDRLLGGDGRPTTVTHAFEVMHGRPCYEIEFSDGSVIVADAEHLWKTTTRASRRQRSQRPPAYQWDADAREAVATFRAKVTAKPDRLVTYGDVVTTEQIASTLRADGDRLNHAVGNSAPIQLPERELPIAPYTLGVWLGDGHTGAARFTTVDPEIVHGIGADGYRVQHSGPMVYSIRPPALPPLRSRGCVRCGKSFEPQSLAAHSCGSSCGGRSRGLPKPPPTGCPDCGRVTASHIGRAATRRCHHASNTSLVGALRANMLLGNKHIPHDYLRASERQRRALLAGLLDTDGTVTNTGSPQFTTTSRRLADDVHELIVSLGYRCSVTRKRVKGRTAESSVAYNLNFTTTDDVFRLPRKREAHANRRRGVDDTGAGSRYIVDARPIASVPVRCVTVDNADHLYLAGRSMIPTHNSTASMDFARNSAIRANQAAAIFSLEMSKVEIVMRLLSAEARVPLHVLRSGQLSDDDWTKLARCMGEISEAPLFVDDTPNMNLMEIRAKARRLKQRHDLKMIVVDYLQLMSSPKRTESRQQEVAELSRGLKLLAKEVECPVIAVSQLNRGPEQRTDKRPQLSDLRESGCLTAGTRILRADSGTETTIGELLSSGATNIPVWSADEKLRYTAKPMTHAFPSGMKEAFTLRLASGRTVEATANHPFLTIDGWRPLGELAPGARIACPRHVPAPLVTVERPEPEVIRLAGLCGREKSIPDEVFSLPKRQVATFLRHLWGSGGSVRWDVEGEQARIYYASTSRRMIDQLALLCLRFGIQTSVKAVSKRGHRDDYRLVISGGDDQLRFLREIGVHGERSAMTQECLAGLVDQKRYANRDTISDDVWTRVRTALAEQGPTHREFAGARGTKARGSSLSKRSPSRSGLSRVAEVLGDAGLEMHATNDVFWDEVVSVQSIGVQPVYDATVLGTHNFIANGIVVHNSIEQDADVVILLHRDDYYDKESPRAGEADFIVAKHRNGPTDTVTVAAQLHLSRFVDMAIV